MIFKVKIPNDELTRIENLIHLKILETEQEEVYNILAEFVTYTMDAPIGGIALIDVHRQWFIPKKGFDLHDVPMDKSFSAHAISNPDEVFVVKDASLDPRFIDNPYVTGAHIRFFAAVPLVTSNKKIVGTLCVADTVPRKSPSNFQKDLLKGIAKLAVSQFELHEFVVEVYEDIQELKKYPSVAEHQEELSELYKRADFILEKIKSRRAV